MRLQCRETSAAAAQWTCICIDSWRTALTRVRHSIETLASARVFAPRSCFLLLAERSASILFPNSDYYIGAYNLNLPHGEGRLYNSAHKLLLSGHFQNGTHVAEPNDELWTAPSAAANAVVSNVPLTEEEEAARAYNIASSECTVHPASGLPTASSGSGSVSGAGAGAGPGVTLPPIPIHLIVPAGPAALLSVAYTHRKSRHTTTNR
jgi:hypothetical protein